MKYGEKSQIEFEELKRIIYEVKHSLNVVNSILKNHRKKTELEVLPIETIRIKA